MVDDTSASRIASGLAGVENYNSGVRYASFGVYPGMLFADTFNRTTGLGAGWQAVYGSYTTNGSAAISGAPPIQGNWAAVAATLATSDYSVQANLVVTAGSLDSGLAVRSSVSGAFDSDVYATKLGSNGTVRLYRRNSWNWTLLASVNADIAAGQTYAVKLVALGTNPVHLETWVNGTKWISYDDTSASRLTAGRVGIVNYDQSTSYADLKVLSSVGQERGASPGQVRAGPAAFRCEHDLQDEKAGDTLLAGGRG